MTVTSALPRQTGPRAGGVPRRPDQPLRLLLLRDKVGELPWVVQTIMRVMAPVEVVPVRTLANALWRLGRERFDSVLLDVGPEDRAAVETCRRHIGDVAAIPVLNLGDDEDIRILHPNGHRPAPSQSRPDPRPPRQPWAGDHRPARPPQHQASDDHAPASRWPPRAGKRRAQKGRPAHLGGALLGGD